MIWDENGQEFKTLKHACRYHSVVDDGRLYAEIKYSGKAKKGGHTFFSSKPGNSEEKKEVVQEPSADSKLVSKLKEIYSPEEFARIISGDGLSRPIDVPKISLHGEHHRILVLSDTHIGSSYSPVEWHAAAAEVAKTEKCECVFHCGDLTEGMKIKRIGTQIYELSDVGFEKQKEKAIKLMSLYNLPIYAIGGNHDAFFHEYMDADIVKAVAAEVPDMTYLGYDTADIDIDGVKIRLWHGGDGNAYALSYRLQKVIESLPGGTKPAILLAGHVHKFCYIFDRNIHAISCPAMQAQTAWMRGKKMASHTGFLILDFEIKDGCVCNLSVKLYPFYA